MHPLRRIHGFRRKNPVGIPAENSIVEVAVPAHFRCPVSLDLMEDPVTLCTGITYDRRSIETWLDAGNLTCPITSQALKNIELIPNHAIRRMIQDWCVKNRSFGIERIPTPRIPITPTEVSEILSGISAATRRRDHIGCRRFVEKINIKGRESERNRRCIIANGSGRVLSSTFDAFAATESDNCEGVLEEILSTLIWMFPIDGDARSHLGSRSSLRCLVSFSKCGDLSRRGNAIFAIKELVSSSQVHADALVDIEGSMEALVKLVREPICPRATKASLIAMFYLVSPSASAAATSEPNKKAISRFVEMGLVSLLLELLVDSENSMCEKALAVLDGICECDKGREKAYDHALTMPILSKKILRVSELATEFAISVIWKLCKNYKREGEFLMEGLQVGVFQKLLLVLQVGCDERTKGKASNLLRLLNVYKDGLECIDSVDFKGLKRSF